MLFLLKIICLNLAFDINSSKAATTLVFRQKSDLLFDDFEKTTDKDISTKYVGYVFAGPNQIHAYPLVCNLNTGDLFYYNTIGDSVYFSMLSQYSNIKFTKSEAMNLYNRALGVAYTNEPQYSYGIVGWYIISEIDLMADRPKYVEYRIAEPNFGVGSDYEKKMECAIRKSKNYFARCLCFPR